MAKLNPPTPLGRARGACRKFALELVTFAKTSSSHIALVGGAFSCLPGKRLRLQGHWGERFEGGFWVDFWLRFACTAMQLAFWRRFCFLIGFSHLFCYASRARCIFGLFLTMP